MPNYSVDAVVSTDGNEYTYRLSIRDAKHCPACGKGFRAGSRTALQLNGDIMEVYHERCVPAAKRPAVVRL